MAKKVSLDKMLDGALLEMFRREFGRVAVNIHDMNTSPTAKREIVITLNIKPDDERQLGIIEASVKSKLCPAESVNGKFLFGYDAIRKEGVASEFKADIINQMELEEMESYEGDGVLDLRKIQPLQNAK
jgi:hypothetical protein